VQLPTPEGQEWAIVFSDLDVITRGDMNEICASIPEGVKFTVIADASCASGLMPHDIINGAGDKVRRCSEELATGGHACWLMKPSLPSALCFVR
jgi:hypothetical protein